jgi:transposase
MTDETVVVTGGVDTHLDVHHAAALDGVGRVLGTKAFPVTRAGFAELLAWLVGFGELISVGVEGTGSYGATLTRFLTASGVKTIEVDRPDRRTRRKQGKSDPLDAIAAARAVLAGTATGTPKLRTGPVESVRVLRIARDGALKARTAAGNQLAALIVTAPQDLRDALAGLSATVQVKRCAAMRPDPAGLTDPATATKHSLHSIAGRIGELNQEIRALDKILAALITTIAPRTIALYGVGPEVAGQLLTTCGDNPDRLRTDAAFARLCGIAPIPVSSGRTDTYRLHRGGDRQANSAFYTIAIVRMKGHQPTRDYVQRRTSEGKGKRSIIRCLKRYAARELLTAITADLTAMPT